MWSEPPLPDMPEVPRSSRPAPAAGGERVSRYSPRARRLCDACVFLIHKYGQGGAPYPKHARWRVSRPERSWYLCNDHKETRL